jgi:hypothetical protein
MLAAGYRVINNQSHKREEINCDSFHVPRSSRGAKRSMQFYRTAIIMDDSGAFWENKEHTASWQYRREG